MKTLLSIIGDAYSYFCIGFTAFVLGGWLSGKPLGVAFAIFIGGAMATGRFLRLVIVESDRRAGRVERLNG